MELKPLFKDIANAIREKDGSTADIVANKFPERIRGIPAGGAVSDQFIRWAVRAYPSTAVKDFKLFHNGYYYCIADGIIYRTQDFLSYERISPIASVSDWVVIFHDGTQLVAKRNNVSTLYSSPDAKTWSTIDTTGLGSTVRNITYFKGKYIAWNQASSGYAPMVSTNLTAWERVTVPGSLGYKYISTDNILITPKYYPTNKSPIIYTEDGETFLNCDPLDSALSVIDIAYTNGIFLACSSGGIVLKSTNGKQWETVAQKDGYAYLASFKNEFLLFPTSSLPGDTILKAIPALHSKDGETWAELENSYGYGMVSTNMNGKLISTNPSNDNNLLIGE